MSITMIGLDTAKSFFLPLFTNGRTASGAISFTSCPRPVSARAQ